MYRHGGDLNRYHELTTEVIERFKSEESAERLSGVVKACLLAEPTVENLSGLVELADRAWDLDPNAPAQVAKALAAYWSEDFEDAIRWAHQCGNDDRQALCVLALANAGVRSSRIGSPAGGTLAARKRQVPHSGVTQTPGSRA